MKEVVIEKCGYKLTWLMKVRRWKLKNLFYRDPISPPNFSLTLERALSGRLQDDPFSIKETHDSNISSRKSSLSSYKSERDHPSKEDSIVLYCVVILFIFIYWDSFINAGVMLLACTPAQVQKNTKKKYFKFYAFMFTRTLTK